MSCHLYPFKRKSNESLSMLVPSPCLGVEVWPLGFTALALPDIKTVTAKEQYQPPTKGLWANPQKFMAWTTARRDPGMKVDACPLTLSSYPLLGRGQSLSMINSKARQKAITKYELFRHSKNHLPASALAIFPDWYVASGPWWPHPGPLRSNSVYQLVFL